MVRATGVGAARAVGEPVNAAIPVAIVDLVAGSCARCLETEGMLLRQLPLAGIG